VHGSKEPWSPWQKPIHRRHGRFSITNMIKAVAYLRVSGKAQVEGDGFPRQREAIAAYARAASMQLVAECLDECVSGTLPLVGRPGLSELFGRVLTNGVCAWSWWRRPIDSHATSSRAS